MEASGDRVDFVDGDAAEGVVELGHAEAGDAHQSWNDEDAGKYDPLALVENAEIVAKGGFVGGDGSGIEALATGVGGETGANLAQDVAACRDYGS